MTETSHNPNADVYYSQLEMDRMALRNIMEAEAYEKKNKTKSSKGKFPSNMQPKKKKRKK